jgi:hypothetical protein
VGAHRDRLARQKDAVLSPARGKRRYIEGQNLTIEYRFAKEQYERLPELAADLVGRHVAIIVASGALPVLLAAKAATVTIPIAFSVEQIRWRPSLTALAGASVGAGSVSGGCQRETVDGPHPIWKQIWNPSLPRFHRLAGTLEMA